MHSQFFSFKPTQMNFFTAMNAFTQRYIPIFTNVPVMATKFELALKAFDAFFFFIKNRDRLFNKFDIVPRKKIIIK